MSQSSDETLMVGVLAVQMNFIKSDVCLEAVKTWSLEQRRSIEEILVDQGNLDPADVALLRSTLDGRLAGQGGDPTRTITALLSTDSRAQEPGTTAGLDTVGLSDQGNRAHIRNSTDSPDFTFGVDGGRPRYHRLHLHARGNIGEVFVARDEELHREVALKQIQEHNADDTGSRTRFCFEAEVTGGLEHPGVVPVYGFSHHANGRPYYAMRLIRGGSLDQAIAAFHSTESLATHGGIRLLTLQKLLRQFLDVCNTVAYAHSRGIIHRDIKPANIMVGKYGETLVVDWGLARSIDPAVAELGTGDQREPRLKVPSGSVLNGTVAGSVIGTPAYMAPEQAAGKLDQLGATSDVYSLGATLYQILTGHAPFGADDLGMVLRRVERGEFLPPRQVDPTIPRPLEAITRKAMATRPADRYATPLDLAADIEHWLADEPTSALLESRGEQLCRWSRRHLAATLAAAATLLGITVVAVAAVFVVAGFQARTQEALNAKVAAVAQTTRALNNANQANQAERQARQATQDEADKANSVVNFLVGLFEEVDPVAAAGRTFGFIGQAGQGLTALDVVDRGAKALSAQLRDRPLIRAAMLDSIGNVYVGLGAVDRAEPLLIEALAIRREKLPPDHLDVAASLHSLGWAKVSQLNSSSVDLLRQALEIRRRHLSSDDPRVATTQFLLAMAISASEQGSTSETDQLLEESLASRRKRLGNENQQVGVQLTFMAYLKAMRGDDIKAAPLFMEAAKIALANGETRLASMLGFYLKAEAVLSVLGHKPALPSYARCLDEATKAFGPDHLVTNFFAMTYGDRLLRAHQPIEAEKQYRACIASLTRLHAPGQSIANVYLNLSRAIRDQGRAAEAEKTAREALAVIRSSRQTGAIRGALGQACEVLGVMIWNRHELGDEPLNLLLESARVRRELYGPDDLTVAGTLWNLARFYEEIHQSDKAIESLAEVVRIARLHPEDPRPWFPQAEANLTRLRPR